VGNSAGVLHGELEDAVIVLEGYVAGEQHCLDEVLLAPVPAAAAAVAVT
jgi:hypothetical protein